MSWVRLFSGVCLPLVLLYLLSSAALAESPANERVAAGYLPVALDLGPARGFNGLFHKYFSSTASDTEGRLAAGTDIYLNHYSVADKLQATVPGISLLVGGNLQYPSGRVYRGNIVVGGSAAGLGDPVIHGLGSDQSVSEFAQLPFDFQEAFERLVQTSQALAALEPNGSFEWQWGGLYLEGDCESPAQVFELNGQQVLDAHTFSVSCIPAGATVIFNVDGEQAGLTNMSLSSLQPHRQRVLFNFHQAQSLTLSGIGIEGSVLAPLAHVAQPQGVIDGSMIARSWDGPMQLNHRPFRGVGAGDFCAMYPIALPHGVLAAAEPGTEFHQLPRGTGPGNFSWLTWAGSPNAPTLANSLIPPGDSYTYVNPDDESDWLLSVGSWVQGAPGAMNAQAVRSRLDALLGVEIVVPAWSSIRGQGNNLDYQVADFARIRLLDYRLPGNGWLSFEFLGFTHCYNRPPLAHPQALETPMGTPLDIELTGEDPDGDALSFELISAPAHGQLSGELPNLQYQPDSNFVGADSFQFRVSDGFLVSAPATVSINVVQGNLPPVAHSQFLQTEVNTPLAIELSGEDPDGDELTFHLLRLPEHGSLTGEAPQLSYYPDEGFVGTDSFEFLVDDGMVGSEPATVEIEVVAGNSPPVIVSEAVTGALQGELYSYTVVAEDPDPGDIVSYSLQQAPAEMGIDAVSGLIQWWPSDHLVGNKPGDNHLCFASGSVDQGTVLAADVIFVVDESGSMSGEHNWIAGFTFGLEAHLLANEVGMGLDENLYGLIGYERVPRPLPVGGQQMGDIYALMTATALLRTSGGTEDGWRAIRHALTDYPMREGSARNIILITDEGRDITDPNITYESLLGELNDANAILNAVVNARFRCRNNEGNWVPALGMDADGIGYLADGQGGYLTCSEPEATWGHTNTISTLVAYVPLALDTGGAAWDLNFLRSGGPNAISFARALTDIKIREILEHLPPRPQSDWSIANLYWASGEVGVEVVNRGVVDAVAEAELRVFANDAVIAVASIPPLASGEAVSLQFDYQPSGDAELTLRAELEVSADEDECVTNNHLWSSPLVAVRATDLGGLYDEQHFSITVAQSNTAPAFVSAPLTTASVGTRYRYTAVAVDSDAGDALRYSLVQGPPGMAIDAYSGVLSYIPNVAHIGVNPVSIQVEDLAGATANQDFELVVSEDYLFPLFSPAPDMRVVINTQYTFQTEVTADPVAELQYQVLRAPTGLLIGDQTGLVSWDVPDNIAGQRMPIALQVRDQYGNYDVLIYDLLGDIPNEPPAITSTPQLIATQGSTYTSSSQVQDPNFFEQHTWSLLEGSPGMTINAVNGQVRWPGSSVSSARPAGVQQHNRYCLVREHEVASFEEREDWRWTSSVTRFTQPLVVPLFFDQSLATPELEGIELIVGITWTGGGINNRALHALDLESGALYWSFADYTPHWGVSPAATDLDHSGIPDILFVDSAQHLVAVDSFGLLRWRSELPVAVPGANLNEAAIVIADLNQDGFPEIVVGSTVFRHDGSLAWRFSSDASWHSTAFRASPLVADLNGNGHLEVAMFNEVRNAAGELLWQLPLNSGETLHRTHFGVGDISGDGRPELAVSLRSNQGSALLVVDADGELLWRHQSSLVTHVSPPLVADLTRNGSSDVFLPGGSILFDATGEVIWSQPSVITRREFRNAIASDLNGDGWVEILMHGGSTFSVISGATGQLLHSVAWSERSDRVGIVPVLVQPDHQPSRIVLGGNSGLLVLQPAWGSWPTRAKHFTQVEFAPAAPRHDNLRIIQPPLLAEPATQLLADLHIDAPRARPMAFGKRLETVILNRGMGVAPGPIHVEFYQGDPNAGGTLLDHSTISQSLMPGQSVTVQRPGFTRQDLEQELFAVVYFDDENVPECFVDNNMASGYPVQIAVEDHGGLQDTQMWTVGVREGLQTPVFVSSPLTSAVENETYTYQAIADDANTGDVLIYRLLLGPKDARLHPRTGVLTWTPRWGQTGSFQFRIEARDLSNRNRQQTFNVVVAESSLPIEPPVILSQPITAVQLGEHYQYPLLAEDPEGQVLTYRVLEGPEGMSIHPRNGLVHWTPLLPEDAPVPVTLQVENERGATAEQSFAISVHVGENQPPQISSQPSLAVNLGQSWSYAIEAFDPDGDPLEFFLLQAPPGAVMGGLGLTEWTPLPDQLGSHAFVVEVRDDRGGWARQSFHVLVNDGNVNQPPEILSMPPMQAYVGLQYAYQVEAIDPDGDPLQFALIDAPAGASLDAASGLLLWTPLAAHIGTHDFELHVLDGNGGLAWQRFVVTVDTAPVGNRAPVIHSTPPLTAKTGLPYRYAIIASDPDDDPLTFALVEGPVGMALDTLTGELTWEPESVGSYPVSIVVSDGELDTSQNWQLEVLDGSVPLGLSLEVTPSVADVGQVVEIRLVPEAAAGEVIAELMVNDSSVPVDPDLVARFTPTQAGQHVVVAAIDDGFEQADAQAQFFVRDPNAEGGPFVALHTPDYEAEITSPTMVIGTVQDDDLAGWTLAWAEAGTQNWTIMAEGTQALSEAEIATFDPTLLINGQYRIALQAWDGLGRTSFDSREIQVTGDMKLGQFAVTFEDATVPLAGIPITLTRTYDTRQRHKDLDFGFGWSVGYQDVRLHESRRVGLGWSLNEYRQGFFSTWCVEPNGDPIVTVRLPDDEVHRFKAKASPECQQLVPFVDVQIVFEPLAGTHSSLQQLDHGWVRLVNGNIVELDDPGSPIDPDRYRLTLEDGTVLRIDQHFGLRQLIDGDDNALTFTRNGISHSSGVGIEFIRDANDRIAQVLLPDGGVLDYVYDASGNLSAFADQLENVTQYTYLAGADHYLEDIIDPRGVRAIRNEYDDDGRLIAQIDADGNRLEFDRDIQGRVETIRDRRGHATVYIYDERGNVLSETNALGETTTRSYDEFGNELTRTDSLGQVWEMAYDSRGNQTAETDPLGHTNHYAYNSRGLVTSHTAPDGTVVMSNQYNPSTGNLTATTDALGNATHFAYDISGNLTRITDANGEETRNFYDSRGNLIREIDAIGTETTYTHDSMGRVLTETVTWTDADGIEQTATTSHVYDAAGNRTQTTDPLGAVTEFEYDEAGQMTAEIDPLGRRTEYEFDNRGNQVLVRYPDGSTETSEYDPEGNLIAETDRAGRTTKMVYDAAGRLIETILPDNTPDDDSDNPRRYSIYDAAGRLAEEVDERGNSTFYEYDDAGRNIKVTDALGNETAYEYDARGQRTAMIDARGNRTEYEYDAAGRLIKTLHANGTESIVEYDALGQKTAETDPSGRTTRFEYDARGNLTAVVDALNQRTEYGYDERGNRISQRDANGHTTTWRFDVAGRTVSRTLPMGQTETYQYNIAGHRTAHTDFKGQTVEYHYDVLSRPIRTEYPNNVVVDTRYNNAGLTWQIEVTCTPAACAQAGKDPGITVHLYDERDRLTRIQYPDGHWIEYSYDRAGNRTEVRTENQRTQYSFDALNRMSTVTACANESCTQGDTTNYSYNEVGSRSLVEHANNTVTEYQYDSLNRLTLLTTWDAFGGIIHRQQFHLGAAGHREMVVEYPERVVEYSYDALYRLTEEKVTDPAGDRTTTYSFDATGNRLSRTVSCSPECNGEVEAGVTTYVYDANDRLLEESGPDGVTIYSYDENGNTTSKVAPNGTVDYHYNADDRLISATGDLESTASEVSYTYDAHGIRQRQVVDGVGGRFLVDPTHQYAQVLEELDGNGAAIVLYVIGQERISQTRAGGIHTYHADGLGSIRALSDVNGTQTDRYVYEAYGLLEHSEGNTENSFRYTGEQYDPNLGFYYLRARYYNPSTGRFPTMDTYQGRIHEPQTLHKYLYVHADPVNLVDPSGNMGIGPAIAVTRNLLMSGLRVVGGVARGVLVRPINGISLRGAPLKARIWLHIHVRAAQARLPAVLQGGGRPASKGQGWVWSSRHAQNEVRIMMGNRRAKFPAQRSDYVQIRSEGRVIGRNGQSLPTKNTPDAHIPFHHWRTWMRWDTPI
ncbi:MAG: choice-of-anchor A family protein [Wenzhouxiangellaceae bacterium]|nr:MAG: choice-of-anchor A family protein [Wenzhouxiangellaceae bacterium]